MISRGQLLCSHVSELQIFSWLGNANSELFDRIDVFGIGDDRRLYQKTYDGQSWSPDWDAWGSRFGDPPNYFLGPPTVCSTAAGSLTLVTRGTDNIGYNDQLYIRDYRKGAWQSFKFFGGAPSTSVSCATSAFFGTERIDWVSLGSDSSIYHRSRMSGPGYDPVYTDWTQHYGDVSSKPEVVTPGANHIDIFALETDGSLTHQTWNDSGWAPAIDAPEDLGGPFITFSL